MSEATGKTVLVVGDSDARKLEALEAAAAEAEARERQTIALRKLDLRPGSVLLVRVPEAATDLILQRVHVVMRKFLHDHNLESVRLLVLKNHMSLEALNEEQMETYGWIRAKKATRAPLPRPDGRGEETEEETRG